MKLSVGKYGSIDGYHCSQCKIYNDILTVHCISCNAYRDENESLSQYSLLAVFQRGIWFHYDYHIQKGDRYYSMTTEQRIELHSKFFNNPEEIKRVSDMTIEQIMVYEDKLEEIIIEAKAKAQRAASTRRERTNKLSQEERDKLVSRPDIDGSDALAAPKLRKERMSKMDKLRETYVEMGLSEDEIKGILGTISVDESKPKNQDVVRTGSKDVEKRYVFNGSPTPIDEDGKEEIVKPKPSDDDTRVIEIKKDSTPESSPEPFDPSKIFGG